MGVAFLTFLGGTISKQTFFPSGSYGLSVSSSEMFPKPWLEESSYRWIRCDWAPYSLLLFAFWSAAIFCSDRIVVLLQGEVSLMGVEAACKCVYKDKYSKGSWGYAGLASGCRFSFRIRGFISCG